MASAVRTNGNPDCHLILRGGRTPNYDAAHVAACCETLRAAGLRELVIDLADARIVRGVLILAFALGLWQALVWLTGVPHFILPAPERVARRLWDARELIAENALITFVEILLGLLLGSMLGVSTALQLAMSPLSRAARCAAA